MCDRDAGDCECTDRSTVIVDDYSSSATSTTVVEPSGRRFKGKKAAAVVEDVRESEQLAEEAAGESSSSTAVIPTKTPQKAAVKRGKFIRGSRGGTSSVPRSSNAVPEELLNDIALNNCIASVG